MLDNGGVWCPRIGLGIFCWCWCRQVQLLEGFRNLSGLWAQLLQGGLKGNKQAETTGRKKSMWGSCGAAVSLVSFNRKPTLAGICKSNQQGAVRKYRAITRTSAGTLERTLLQTLSLYLRIRMGPGLHRPQLRWQPGIGVMKVST